MIFIREFSGTDVLDFGEYEEIEHINFIIKNLNNNFDFKMIEKLDGPGATLWDILIDTHSFTLVHNSYGNYLKPTTNISKEYLHEIYQKLKILFY